MKIGRMLLCLVLAMALLFSLGLGVSAGETMVLLSKAYLNYGITITYNGEPQIMHDVNGKRVYPITYQGTTYLPVRAVSGMLDVAVEWDNDTKTVILGDQNAPVDFIETLKPYSTAFDYKHVSASENQTVTIADTTADHWIEMTKYGKTDKGSAFYNVTGLGSTLTFKIYCTNSYSAKDGVVQFWGDNELLETVNVKNCNLPATHTIDIEGVSQLQIVCDSPAEVTATGGWPARGNRIYIFDAFIQ